jgi:putative membrane protein
MQNTGTVLGIILVVVLVVLLLGGAGMMGFSGFGMMGPGMMGSYGGMMGGYGNLSGFGFNPLGAILSLVFWALITGGVALLVVWLARSAGVSSAARGESALDILKTRYAKGEITKEQFEEMKRNLGA